MAAHHGRCAHHGGHIMLKIGNSNYSNGPHRSLVRFDISELDTASLTIHRATLRMDNTGQWDTGHHGPAGLCDYGEPWTLTGELEYAAGHSMRSMIIKQALVSMEHSAVITI